MWAPALFDIWHDPDQDFSLYSFAIITDDPPPEILAAGHDRCPIFLNQGEIDLWLNPKGKKPQEILQCLQHQERVVFGCQ